MIYLGECQVGTVDGKFGRLGLNKSVEIEYMQYNFNRNSTVNETQNKINGQKMPRCGHLKHLGSTIKKNGDIQGHLIGLELD